MRESLLSIKDELFLRRSDSPPYSVDNDHADPTIKVDDDDEDDDDSRYGEYFTSIRTTTGLEVGYKVTWPGSKELTISTCFTEQSIAPLFNGTQWAGTRIWRASIVALEYLLHISSTSSESQQLDVSDLNVNGNSNIRCGMHLDENKTILELGCGLGVPGMILHAMRGCNVVLTDMDDLVEQIRKNLKQNFHCSRVYEQQICEDCFDVNNHESNSIQALALDWSSHGVRELLFQSNFKDGFDVVLNCDCIFEPLYGASWKYLLQCQEELLRVRPTAVVITSVERRRLDGIEKYLDAASQSPVISRVEKIDISFDHPVEIEMYQFHGLQCEE